MFEYEVIVNYANAMSSLLNEYGRAGWHTRAFNYIPAEGKFWALLEREIPAPPPDQPYPTPREDTPR